MIFSETAFREYRNHPYLRKAHIMQLKQRHADVLQNLWVAHPPGRARLHDMQGKLDYWSRKLTETRSEMMERGLIFSVQFLDGRILIRNADVSLPSDEFLNSIHIPSNPIIVRFSKSRFINDSLYGGRFLVRPASEYNDASLNAAQKDEELSHHSIRSDRHIPIKLYGYGVNEDPSQTRLLEVEPLELFSYMLTKNFYVLCMSSDFDARMFADFSADAVLIINDPKEFIERVMRWTAANRTDLNLQPALVEYYDPYRIEQQQLKPGISKHFSYAYQQELRLIWWPLDHKRVIEPFFMEIGDISDIAEASSI